MNRREFATAEVRANGLVTHLYSDERVQAVAEGVIPLVTERIREMLGGG